jgi:hypothetical protein
MSNIPNHQTRPHISVRCLNLDTLRRDLAAIESVCREARASRDRRVPALAVHVIHRRASEIAELLDYRP